MVKGQKVVCTNDSFTAVIRAIYKQLPVKGNTYTIREVFLGREKVVKGGQSFRDFFCGKCCRSWRVADDGEREPTKRGETPRRRPGRR